ncbi:hypothetical protein KP803_02850 [Vibrio sp. ZSDE26]|uniref:Uncharacterized protein n=1 Tax=Vibrio amylolyticus TaxID=2847292 RepID=A0A9X1XH25_9VIBR|nr:hypothetical protein [Vibrio amylolyticus]MCK6262211.1 hypothetical protein [Vibrio amylolyticus]
MKRTISIYLTALFSFSVIANTGTPQTGPLVDCKLSSGDVVRMTSFLCKQNGGQRG